jgi:hypothetical protein
MYIPLIIFGSLFTVGVIGLIIWQIRNSRARSIWRD